MKSKPVFSFFSFKSQLALFSGGVDRHLENSVEGGLDETEIMKKVLWHSWEDKSDRKKNGQKEESHEGVKGEKHRDKAAGQEMSGEEIGANLGPPPGGRGSKNTKTA